MRGKTTDGRFVDFEFGSVLTGIAFERVEFDLSEMREYTQDRGKEPEEGWNWFWVGLLPWIVSGGTIEMRTTAEKL